MLTMILTWAGNLLGGPFARAAVDAYRARLAAENTTEKIAAELAARELAVEAASASLRASFCSPSKATGSRVPFVRCGRSRS